MTHTLGSPALLDALCCDFQSFTRKVIKHNNVCTSSDSFIRFLLGLTLDLDLKSKTTCSTSSLNSLGDRSYLANQPMWWWVISCHVSMRVYLFYLHSKYDYPWAWSWKTNPYDECLDHRQAHHTSPQVGNLNLVVVVDRWLIRIAGNWPHTTNQSHTRCCFTSSSNDTLETFFLLKFIYFAWSIKMGSVIILQPLYHSYLKAIPLQRQMMFNAVRSPSKMWRAVP